MAVLNIFDASKFETNNIVRSFEEYGYDYSEKPMGRIGLHFRAKDESISGVRLKVSPEHLQYMKSSSYSDPVITNETNTGIFDVIDFVNSSDVQNYVANDFIFATCRHKYDPLFGLDSSNNQVVPNLSLKFYEYDGTSQFSETELKNLITGSVDAPLVLLADGVSMIGNKGFSSAGSNSYYIVMTGRNGCVNGQFCKAFISNAFYSSEKSIGEVEGLTFELTGDNVDSILSYDIVRNDDGVYEITLFNGDGEVITTAAQSVGLDGSSLLDEFSIDADGITGKIKLYKDYTFILKSNNDWAQCSMVQDINEISPNFENISLISEETEYRYWDIVKDLSPNGEVVDEGYLVRINITGIKNSTTDFSNYRILPFICSANILIKNIDFSFGTINEYTNIINFNFPVFVTEFNTFSDVKFYSSLYSFSNTSIGNVDRWSSIIVSSDTSTKCTVNFSGIAIGLKTVYVQLRDKYYNKSEVKSFDITFSNVAPFDLFLKLFGTNNNSNYTGIAIGEDGSFSVDNSCKVQFYADSALPLEYNISGNVINDPDNGIGSVGTTKYFKEYPKSGDAYDSLLIDINLAPYNNYYVGVDRRYEIVVTFRDAAGNMSSIVKNIRYNTKLFETKYKNIQKQSANYSHVVMDIVGESTVTIPEKKNNVNVNGYVRSWKDIFYPATHSYPIGSNGEIDENVAIRMNGVSDNTYDAVQISNGRVYRDSEGRPITVDWKNDGTKNYNNLCSSQGELVYWIIDNTGYGDIQLEFEYFNLDEGSYGPPYNNSSPHPGDCVVIYDCSSEDAVTSYVNKLGEIEYKLKGTTYLGQELDAFRGSGTKVYSYQTGSVGSNADGGFKTPVYQSTRICVIFYSDVAGTGSGFKIKSSPKRESSWYNWDLDTVNGLVWIHQYSDLTDEIGKSADSPRLIYNYNNTNYHIDYDSGEIYFDSDLGEKIYGYYTYYDYGVNENPPSNVFASYFDDYVDYSNYSVWFNTYGTELDKNSQEFPIPAYPTLIPMPSGYKGVPFVNHIGYFTDLNTVEITKNLDGSDANITSVFNNHDVYLSIDDGVNYTYHGIIVKNHFNKLTIKWYNDISEIVNISSSSPIEYHFKLMVGYTGKITSKFNIDKDCGFVTFTLDNNNIFNNQYGFVPRGRLFIDYYYHTYTRLTNDGYGNFYFYDEVIVPDNTTKYHDYTWGDIKLVNEGNATLEDGKMKFLSRGVDSAGDGTVDQVLDYERPWDAQQGTPDETFDKVAILWSTAYTFNSSCTRNDAIRIFRGEVPYGSNAVAGKNVSFPTLIEPKGVLYGRVVWVLGGSGTDYPKNPTSGKKCFSSEIEGSYYNIE